MMDLTVREIDAFATGHDKAQRINMATMLWAAWSGAQFNSFVWGGKRLPNIEPRLNKIMDGSAGKGRSEVADVIERMNMIALQAGMPPPRKRAPFNPANDAEA